MCRHRKVIVCQSVHVWCDDSVQTAGSIRTTGTSHSSTLSHDLYPPPPTSRWSGTFAQYSDTTPGTLAKILASASNCLDAYCHSFISHLLGLWTHSVSHGIQ